MEHVTKSPEQLALDSAMELVAKARAKVAEEEAKKLEIAAQAVALFKAEQERIEFERKAWALKIEAEWAAKKKADADAQIAKQNAETARRMVLEAEYNRLEAAKLERESTEREIAKQTALAHELERVAESTRAELIRQSVREHEESVRSSTYEPAGPVTQVGGLDLSEGGLEAPGQLNSHLRRLFGRSAEVATIQTPVVPQTEQAPLLLPNEDILVGVKSRYGAQVVDDAIAYLKTKTGVTNLQVYLSQNFKPLQ